MRTQIWTPASAAVANSFVVASDPPAMCIPANNVAAWRAPAAGNGAYGGWGQTFSAAAYAYDLAIYEIYIGQIAAARTIYWRLGAGAAGSEVMVRSGYMSTAANVPHVAIIDPPYVHPASTRLTLSLWDVFDGGGWQFDAETLTINAYRPPVLMAEKRDMTAQAVDMVPAAGGVISASCAAGSWGAWVQCWAGLAYATALTGYEAVNNAANAARSVQFGIGAAGSEVALAGIYRNLRRGYTGYCNLPVGVRVPANARLAVRLYNRDQNDSISWRLYRTRLPM